MLSFVLSLSFWGNASMQISGWAKKRVATRLTKRERAMLRALDGGMAGLGKSDDEMREESDDEAEV